MNELTTTEVSRLESLERIIAKGMRSFVDVGLALAEIQGNRLYRDQHETFEAYCQERWNFTAARGRQLAGAVSAMASLPADLPKPSSASQAEALAKVDDADRAEVWRDAITEASRYGKNPTAKDIRRIDETRKSRGDDGVSDWIERSKGEEEMAHLAPLFIEMTQILNRALDVADTLSRTSAREWLLTSGSALLTNIRAAKEHVHAAKPAGICPTCGGNGCAKCFGTGWMNSTRLSSARRSR
jgi:hypothetical protein